MIQQVVPVDRVFLGLNPAFGCVGDFQGLLMVGVILSNKVAGLEATQKKKKKEKRNLHQQLTIIYFLMFRLHTVARETETEWDRQTDWQAERKPVRVYEQTQRNTCRPSALYFWQSIQLLLFSGHKARKSFLVGWRERAKTVFSM